MTSASPIRPAPRIAILRSSMSAESMAGERPRLTTNRRPKAIAVGSGSSGACGCCPRPSSTVGARSRDETSLEAREQEHAREPLPLAVGCEQPRGLVCDLRLLGPAAGPRRQDLHEPEVGDQARVVAAESAERDDTGAPRAEAALSSEPHESRVGRRLQRLEVDRSHDPGKSRRAAGSEPARGDSGGGEGGERSLARRVLAARANHRSLDVSRAARLDQLPADGVQDCVRNGRLSRRPQTPEHAHGAPEQRIASRTAGETRSCRRRARGRSALRRPPGPRTLESTTVPFGLCRASAHRPPGKAERHSAVQVVSFSEYGPRGSTRASTIEPAYSPHRSRYLRP